MNTIYSGLPLRQKYELHQGIPLTEVNHPTKKTRCYEIVAEPSPVFYRIIIYDAVVFFNKKDADGKSDDRPSALELRW